MAAARKSVLERRSEIDEAHRIDENYAYEYITNATENLIKKGHMNLNSDSNYQKEIDSVGTISECDEQDIAIMFKEGIAFRFEAQKKIQQGQLEKEKALI